MSHKKQIQYELCIHEHSLNFVRIIDKIQFFHIFEILREKKNLSS